MPVAFRVWFVFCASAGVAITGLTIAAMAKFVFA
jgi:hypothetical protein